MAHRHLDDRNILWKPLGDFKYFRYIMLDVDPVLKIVDFLIKFDPDRQIFLHRHLALTNTLVIEGEHRLYEPEGKLKEIRSAGSYTSSAPGGIHREGGGQDGAVVFYSVRGNEGLLFEELDDNLQVVSTLGLQDFLRLYQEQQRSEAKPGV